MNKGIGLVTGAAQGIGYACAAALLPDVERVILADINAEGVQQAAQRLGARCVPMTCDMAEPEQVLSMFELIEAEHGAVSVLVNNAGVALPGDILEASVADFQTVLNINLVGTFVATQRAAQTMVAQGIRGAIVNMSSINAQLAIATIPAYCASKGGISQLTKAAALSLAPHGIRVNAVGPGSIDTAMMASVNQDTAAMQRVLSRTPLQRVGTPEEIGEVVAFLASDKASYITGQTLYVDGGRAALNYTV